MLNRYEREMLSINCIHEIGWRKHYSNLCYDTNEEQNDNVECGIKRTDNIRIQKLSKATKEVKNCKAQFKWYKYRISKI